MFLDVTLEDDLFGTSAADNQVQTPRKLKTDKEGHAADEIADCYLQLVLDGRFRRRGEKKDLDATSALKRAFDSRGEVALNSVMLTADRDYGRPSFLEEVRKLGPSFLFVMPNHIVRYHPFVARSAFNPGYDDEVEQIIIDGEMEDANSNAQDDAQDGTADIGHMNCNESGDRS